MSREEGLNEAYALAMTDGLFDEEVVELDEKTNKLSVNLKSTFCQSVQESAGCEYSSFEIAASADRVSSW